jgi:hypothetical protein
MEQSAYTGQILYMTSASLMRRREKYGKKYLVSCGCILGRRDTYGPIIIHTFPAIIMLVDRIKSTELSAENEQV